MKEILERIAQVRSLNWVTWNALDELANWKEHWNGHEDKRVFALRSALEQSPQKARAIIHMISENDQEIVDLLRVLANGNAD